MGNQGVRDGYGSAPPPGRCRSFRSKPADSGYLRPYVRRRGGGRPAKRRFDRLHRREQRAQARRGHQHGYVPCLYRQRHRRGRGGRSDQERSRHRRWNLGWAGLRCQHAHRHGDARPDGDDPLGRRAGRREGHVHGPVRNGRPRPHLHRQSVPKPPIRPRARQGCRRRGGAQGDRTGCGRLLRGQGGL